MTLAQRRLALWGGLGALLVLFLVYAFRPRPIPVDFAEVTRGRLAVTVDEEGETRVRDVFTLSAPVAGRTRRIDVEVGDPVTAGETVVAQIEPVDPTLLDVRSKQEAEAAKWVKENMKKPVVGYVAGLTAPKGRRMGHAGAIISAAGDTAAEKAEIMKSYGLFVAPSASELGSTVAQALTKAR